MSDRIVALAAASRAMASWPLASELLIRGEISSDGFRRHLVTRRVFG
jgi:hypothetical protein